MRYKRNLRVVGDEVYSYGTHVATIEGCHLIVHGYWSMTTTKHVNYVARELGLEIVKGERVEKRESSFRRAGMVAKLGELLCHSEKDANEWKLRMLKAGIPGLDVPEDFSGLDEKEKKRRLDGVIKIAMEGKRK